MLARITSACTQKKAKTKQKKTKISTWALNFRALEVEVVALGLYQAQCSCCIGVLVSYRFREMVHVFTQQVLMRWCMPS